MKKLFFYAALFAAGFAVTSCTSDKDVVADENLQGDINGSNYIAVSISLPTNASTTRSADEGLTEFADGLDAEFAVNDGTLIIFNSSDQFIEAHDLGTLSFSSTGTDEHVTQFANSTNIVRAVSKSIAPGYKMLVVLNHNDLLHVTSTHGLQYFVYGSSTKGTYDTYATVAANTEYATLQALVTIAKSMSIDNAAAMTTSGIFMSNAPLSDTQGSTTTNPSSAALQVLVPITEVYPTSTAASSATNPDQIYVERAVAKVTMSSKSGNFESAKLSGTALTYTLSGWTLDNTNQETYLVRSTANFDTYRSLKSNGTASAIYRTIGNTNISFPSTPTYAYRVYFSECAGFGSTNLNKITSTPTWNTTFDGGATAAGIAYCFENTFAVANQTVDKTTLVQLEVTAGDGTDDLYIIGSNRSTVYNTPGLLTLIANKAIEYIKANSSTYVESGTELNAADFSNLTTTDSDNDGDVDVITIKYTPTGTNATLKNAAYADGTGTDKTLSTTLCAAILSAYSSTITKYVEGKSYYNIRIKHFGDELTPWNTWEAAAGKTAPSGSTIAEIYPNNDSNQAGDYLGRYGVLRNNWYNISVNKIRFLGEPVPNTTTWPGTPDDELDTFIAFKINILSWAKRTQSVDL